MNEEKTSVDKSANLDWLQKYPTVATNIMCVFNDQFDSIKKRLIDKSKNELSSSVDAPFFAKTVAKSFVQSVSTSMENLIELKLGIIKELRNRHPLLGDDWLYQESETSECNGIREDVKSQVDLSDPVVSVSTKSLDDVDSEQKLPKDNENNPDVVTTNELTLFKDINTEENMTAVEETGAEKPNIENAPNGDIISEVVVENVADIEKILPMDVDEHKANQNVQSVSVQPIVEQMNDCDKDSALTESAEEPQKSHPVIDDQVPGPSRLFHLSTKRMAKAKKREFEKVPAPDSSDTDYEIAVPLAKRIRKATNVNLATVNKSKPKPKSKQQQPKPKSKQQQPKPKSKQKTSAEEQQPQPPNKEQPEPLVKQQESPRYSTRRGPLSCTNRKSYKAEEVKLNISQSIGTSDAGAPLNNYWETHDFHDDEKLKYRRCVVIVEKKTD